MTVLPGGRVGGPSTALITLITTVKTMPHGWAFRVNADRIESRRAESCCLATCYLLLIGRGSKLLDGGRGIGRRVGRCQAAPHLTRNHRFFAPWYQVLAINLKKPIPARLLEA